MKYNLELHHRHSIRLKNYDYSRAGAYFLTLCAQNRELLFDPPPVREMIQRWWDRLPDKFPGLETDVFVIMPNHVHAIIVLTGDEDGAGNYVSPTVGDVVRWFKTMTTNEYIRGVKNLGWAPFPGKFWQRNYYERVIRDTTEWNHYREYIQNNPLRWPDDSLHPNQTP